VVVCHQYVADGVDAERGQLVEPPAAAGVDGDGGPLHRINE
jgi:hypothetical protein